MVVTGDSHLVITFMNPRYRPSKPDLFWRVAKARNIISKLWGRMTVHFTHVKRNCNEWADWLGRCALHAEADVNLEELVTRMPVHHEAVPRDFVEEEAGAENGTDLLQAFGQHHAPVLPLCIRCGEGIQRCQQCRCGGCALRWHSHCMPAGWQPTRRGPWYCPNCIMSYR